MSLQDLLGNLGNPLDLMRKAREMQDKMQKMAADAGLPPGMLPGL